ncbi:aminoglycoside phosphotransferase family protein [Streptomyces sp. 8K308]|uniref:phosphotransferase family protein n=1 Tax=Streptomyces sp. 8K308 TaxID=2530388 RepID=UPI00104BDC1E|nr:phosphotransferase [Streptomyces sp. 8K308]TDC22865.1 aminoglycoside phosphotransferase family protein [Streptomyces sp. 8K308]
MNAAEVTAMLPGLLAEAALPDHPDRRPIRVWARSGVERLTFPGGASAVFKYAEAPFDHEDRVLRAVAAAGLPVPAVRAARHTEGLLGMLIEDLGEPVRAADDLLGATTAVQIHRITALADLPRLGEVELASLPGKIARRLARHGASDDARSAATALCRAADTRAKDAESPPFGLVHSEFHPTSLHVGAAGLRILDLARAFIGPGLLDLASWHGTTTAPDVNRAHAFLTAYAEAGGPAETLADRGGQNPAAWALGWHRVWVAEWFAQQIGMGWAEGAEDTWTTVITRHLLDAAELLNV